MSCDTIEPDQDIASWSVTWLEPWDDSGSGQFIEQKAYNPTHATKMSCDTIEPDQDNPSWSATLLEPLAHNSLRLDEQMSTHVGATSVTKDFGTGKHNTSTGDHDTFGPKDTGSKLSCMTGSIIEASHNLSADGKVSPISLAIGGPSPSSVAGNQPLYLGWENHCGSSFQGFETLGLRSNPWHMHMEVEGGKTLPGGEKGRALTVQHSEAIPSIRSECSKPVPLLSAGQLVFDANMLPLSTRKLRKKTRAEREASQTLRNSGGACPQHKAAKKACRCFGLEGQADPQGSAARRAANRDGLNGAMSESTNQSNILASSDDMGLLDMPENLGAVDETLERPGLKQVWPASNMADPLKRVLIFSCPYVFAPCSFRTTQMGEWTDHLVVAHSERLDSVART
ncbi:hypothetical protein EPUS_05069 [Endocarpon pusillum Z07020]|uniref:Uncharacterized protein n=1 Tax=Endocarpon pusillum (strain Z07020 / HMAS-L-300199) TaxID=1263415 RepID=U1G0I5_ENDPU|nr:uncharacterized protein EPUS_05069 [Endocarpon pusillum Z07020]ERF70717.1 hypothetical protein EPUS_05069 [Endocarpon pusillum Z07020]